MITLNNDQQQSFDNISAWLKTLDTTPQLLIGPAGSGKTLLVSKLIDSIPTKQRSKIAIAAPTHKAVAVLRQYTDSTNVKFGTSHSLLGLKQDVDSEGNIKFKSAGRTQMNKIKYLFLDEVSMLTDEIFSELMVLREKKNLKIVFIGDKYQIPPVNKVDSMPLLKDYQEMYNMQIHELHKIERQDNAELANNVRKYIINNLHTWDVDINQFVDNKSIINSGFDLIDTLDKYFNCDAFKNNSNHCKVIAWTNAQVNEFNNIIRQLIYQQYELPKLMVGESLIMDSPYIVDGEILLNTNEEVTVKQLSTKVVPIFNNAMSEDVKVYVASVETENGIEFVNIVHEDEEHIFKRTLQEVATEAKYNQNPYERRKLWKLYYDTLASFGQIKYNYAITAHKSQGSTYNTSIISMSDLKKNSKTVEKNRIIYTTMTRYKEKCYLV